MHIIQEYSDWIGDRNWKWIMEFSQDSKI